MSEAELPVLSLAIAAGCLAFATVLALSVEALVTGASSRPAHGSENEAVADKDAYDIFQVGTATKSGADVVAVVRGCLTEPTMLVSDETAEDGARIRRLRFFLPRTNPMAKRANLCLPSSKLRCYCAVAQWTRAICAQSGTASWLLR